MAETTRTRPMSPIVKDDPPAPLHVAARPSGHGRVVVTVHGEIDLSNVLLLEQELAVHEPQPWLVVDMSQVRFCGVVGARLLHAMAIRSSAGGRRFEVVASQTLARVLDATGLAGDITRVSAAERTPGAFRP